MRIKNSFRTLSVAAVAVATAATLAACGSDKSTSGGSSDSGSGKTYKIAVAETITHPSLDESIKGFKAAIKDAGLNVNYDDKNANGDQTVIASIAGQVANGSYDLALGVATPMAQGLAQQVNSTPVLFTAVTDPVDAGLVKTLDEPGGNVTGTSDKNPVKEQLELVKEIKPEAKTVGVLYNPGEANSVVQVNWVKEEATKLGLEVKEATAVTTAEVQQAADSLSVDAIYVPTDNTVVSALDSVIQAGEQKKIPVIAAEGDSVAKGCVATYGISYYELGYQTGKMAVSILKDGKKPESMPVETQSNLLFYVNKGAAERMGVTVPQSLLDKAKPENVTN